MHLKFQPFIFYFVSWIRLVLGSFVSYYSLDQYYLELYVNKKYLKKILCFFKKHTNTQFSLLNDLVCVDYPGNHLRFELNYLLLSLRYS